MDEVTTCAGKAAGGDHAAWQRFIRLTEAEVWRFCAHHGGREHAGDLTRVRRRAHLRPLTSAETARAGKEGRGRSELVRAVARGDTRPATRPGEQGD